MRRERRALIESLFEGALDLPEEARDPWLDGVCGQDFELKAEVRALLEAHRLDGGIVDTRLAPATADHAERERPPRPIGPYRILEEVGRGGMSVVYRAERSDGQFRRRVALKVLRGGLDARELHARLSAERQILASLDHPNIARLLDGGVTEEGRPYLVMEYVEGEALTAHCDRLALGVEARIGLFLQVVRAVQHAHARLVVHRDLKPSNILVTPGGDVRLLDFGIAKVLDVRGLELEQEDALLTRTGIRLFTPEYASPEQLRGDPASVANDIWALGVVLYELLTGARPFEADEGGPRALERSILEEDPPYPSLRVLSGTDERAGQRGLGRQALHRILRGDLDRIVAMALRKETNRRYPFAEQLAEDLERHLDGLPVRAQPDRAAYRIGKFVRRHRLEVAAAALVLLSVVGGSGVALWQAREARMERDRAEEAARRSDAAATYVLDLFRAADPWELPADRLTARELLERGEARLDEVADDPILRAKVLLAIGQTYARLEDARAARPLLEEALFLRTASLGPDDPATAEARRLLADLLRRDGRLAQAEELALRSIVSLRGREGRRAPAPDPAEEAATLSVLGFVHTGMGRLDEARADFQGELDLLRARGLGSSPEVGHALINLAAVHRRMGRYVEAEAFLREALAHRRGTLGEEHPLTAVALARLGGLLAEHLGRYEEAATLFHESLAIQDRVLGPDHPSRIEGLGGLALVQEALGDLPGAEAYLRESVRTHEAGLGHDHPTAMAAAEGLARFLARNGRGRDADSIYSLTLPARRAALGAEHPSVSGSLVGWGEVLLGLGRADEAEAALREALRIRREVYGDRHALVGLSLAALAEVHAVRGETGRERALLCDAVGILEASHSPEHPETLAVRARLGPSGEPCPPGASPSAEGK